MSTAVITWTWSAEPKSHHWRLQLPTWSLVQSTLLMPWQHLQSSIKDCLAGHFQFNATGLILKSKQSRKNCAQVCLKSKNRNFLSMQNRTTESYLFTEWMDWHSLPAVTFLFTASFTRWQYITHLNCFHSFIHTGLNVSSNPWSTFMKFNESK